MCWADSQGGQSHDPSFLCSPPGMSLGALGLGSNQENTAKPTGTRGNVSGIVFHEASNHLAGFFFLL